MNPVDAFTYLAEKNLPLILSFQMEEDRGHVITGKGICYIDRIHGSSRFTMGNFSPVRVLKSLLNTQMFYANFEISGRTYGCLIEDIIVDRKTVAASIPQTLSPFLRKYVRVEPSSKSPVTVHLNSTTFGTLAFSAKDISERGIGFVADSNFHLEKELVCGIEFPEPGRTIVLSKSSLVYAKEIIQKTGFAPDPKTILSRTGGTMHHYKQIAFGIELYPHNEDAKRIRLYIMQREQEIQKKIQEQW